MLIALTQAILPTLKKEWESYQPLGLGYLSSFIKGKFPDVEVFIPKDENEMLAAKPDVVGISSVSYNFKEAERLGKIAKDSGAFTIIGGTHITALPESLPNAYDVGVLGEGEYTFFEVIDALKNSRKIVEEFDKIGGIVFRDKDRKLRFSRRELIYNLDELPFPDRKIFEKHINLNNSHVALISSRGCPYDCAFCSTVIHWGKRIRNFSADYIVRELTHVIERYNPHIIEFVDDFFLNDKKRLKEVCERIISEKLFGKHVEVHLTGRSNFINEETCELISGINTKKIFMGFESMSDSVLESMNKRAVSNEINARAVELLNKYNIETNASFIIGTPGETIDDIYKTFQYIFENVEKFCHIQGSILRIFPGTKYWRDAIDKGFDIKKLLDAIVLDPEDSDGWKFLHTKYPVLTKTMTREEIMLSQILFLTLENWVVARAELRAKNSDLRKKSEDIALLLSKNIDALGIKKMSAELIKKISRKLSK